MSEPRILHCFADHGTEAEVLARYGRVVRIGLNAADTNASEPITADAHQLPIQPDIRFDFGLFHPPCTKWSDMPDADKNGDAPNLLPLAREIGREHCEHWVIENKPRAPLSDPVVLEGDMFGLPIDYARAFEASFEIPEPPRYARFENESSSYFYSEKSRAWWGAVKGIHHDRYTKRALCKNSLPAPYVQHIVRAWLDASGRAAGPSDYAEYDKRKTAERRRAANESLAAFDGGESR